MTLRVISSSVYEANIHAGYASVLVTGANGVLQIAANSTGGNSTIGNPAAGDFVVGASIAGLRWSTDTQIIISRGANVVATLNGSGVWSASNGFRGIDLDVAAATLSVNTSSANSTIVIDLKKKYT